MISFEPQVGKVQTGQTSRGFAVIIPIIYEQKQKVVNILTRRQEEKKDELKW